MSVSLERTADSAVPLIGQYDLTVAIGQNPKSRRAAPADSSLTRKKQLMQNITMNLSGRGVIFRYDFLDDEEIRTGSVAWGCDMERSLWGQGRCPRVWYSLPDFNLEIVDDDTGNRISVVEHGKFPSTINIEHCDSPDLNWTMENEPYICECYDMEGIKECGGPDKLSDAFELSRLSVKVGTLNIPDLHLKGEYVIGLQYAGKELDFEIDEVKGSDLCYVVYKGRFALFGKWEADIDIRPALFQVGVKVVKNEIKPVHDDLDINFEEKLLDEYPFLKLMNDTWLNQVLDLYCDVGYETYLKFNESGWLRDYLKRVDNWMWGKSDVLKTLRIMRDLAISAEADSFVSEVFRLAFASLTDEDVSALSSSQFASVLPRNTKVNAAVRLFSVENNVDYDRLYAHRERVFELADQWSDDDKRPVLEWIIQRLSGCPSCLRPDGDADKLSVILKEIGGFPTVDDILSSDALTL